MNKEVKSAFMHDKWMLCSPAYYDVTYEINPWMSVKTRPEKNLSLLQWKALYETLTNLGLNIELIPQAKGWPDMVFTANGGLARNNKFIVSSFRYKERSGEEPFFRSWFEERGFEVLTIAKGAFEGEGDALWKEDILFGGYGFRSDESVYDEVAEKLDFKRVVTVKLIDSRFYHLDTCFAPISNGHALCFLPGISSQCIKSIENEVEILSVPEKEAVHFACNAVVYGKKIVLPAGCPETYRLLEGQGFEPLPHDLTEYIKAGGAAKCLTLRI